MSLKKKTSVRERARSSMHTHWVGAKGEGERNPSRLPTERGVRHGAQSHDPKIRPEPKPRVGRLTDYATQAPLDFIFK